jgi:hypothetical protein
MGLFTPLSAGFAQIEAGCPAKRLNGVRNALACYSNRTSDEQSDVFRIASE